MDNMAVLASRRNKYRQTARVERRTSNFLELPGTQSVSQSVSQPVSVCLVNKSIKLLLFNIISIIINLKVPGKIRFSLGLEGERERDL